MLLYHVLKSFQQLVFDNLSLATSATHKAGVGCCCRGLPPLLRNTTTTAGIGCCVTCSATPRIA